jgi:hypothetical protein
VVVGDPEGGFVFRLLSDLSRFECVYGRGAAALLKPVVESAENSLTRHARERSPLESIVFESEGLSVSAPWVTSGKTMEQVLARLYKDVVTLEPSEEKRSRDFVTLDTEQVRRLVSEELKRIAGIGYEQIVVNPKHAIASDDGGQHVLEFNLRPPKGAGSVLSAVYKTPDTVELNLLRAGRDLATYGKIRHIGDLALFIMTAKRDQFANAAEYSRLSGVIDEQSWRLERQGFQVVAFDEPQPIAKSIFEWARL